MISSAGPAVSAVDAERRAALQAAKLEALVSTRWGADPNREQLSFGRGAASVGKSPQGDVLVAWVYPVDHQLRVLGMALLWAVRHGIGTLNLLVDEVAGELCGALARRATYFYEPHVAVWRVPGSGNEGGLEPVVPVPARARREPVAAPELVDLLLDAGVQVVVEGGVVRGEVNGLEIARIVHGHTSAGEPIEEPQLEVGVGAADRELTGLVHAGLSPAEQLARAVEIVRPLRSPGAPAHPLNQLVPERWLRATAVRRPELLGLTEIRPVEGAQPRSSLSEPAPATASARTDKGQPVVLAFSVGVDVDLVPAAADARGVVNPGAELWLVLPERDDHVLTRHLASQLVQPAAVIPVPDNWPHLVW